MHLISGFSGLCNRVKVQYIDVSCKAHFLQGATKACGFPQLQVPSFGPTAGTEAGVEAHVRIG